MSSGKETESMASMSHVQDPAHGRDRLRDVSTFDADLDAIQDAFVVHRIEAFVLQKTCQERTSIPSHPHETILVLFIRFQRKIQM